MEHYLVVVWSDGSISHEAMQLEMRANVPPKEVGFVRGFNGTWRRLPTNEAIESHLARVAQRRLELDNVTLVGWRTLTLEEHLMFGQNREYRAAMEVVGGTIQYNMAKARECHRERLRHINGDRFLRLDRQWVNAFASGDRAAADSVEAVRKELRDLVNDPRIDAAQTLEELKLVVPPPEQ